jgi:hypothetical protein
MSTLKGFLNLQATDLIRLTEDREQGISQKHGNELSRCLKGGGGGILTS